MAKMTEAQLRALGMIEPAPMLRGTFLSGWGPRQSGYGAYRIDVAEATANKLLSLGLIERRDVEGNPRASTIRITDAGRLALTEAGKQP